MQIVDQEITKLAEAFKILELRGEEKSKHEEKLKNLLMMDMAAEAMAEKGIVEENVDFVQEEVEAFLEDNYEPQELEKLAQSVSRDVCVEYFLKLIKDAPEEQAKEVEDVLNNL